MLSLSIFVVVVVVVVVVLSCIWCLAKTKKLLPTHDVRHVFPVHRRDGQDCRSKSSLCKMVFSGGEHEDTRHPSDGAARLRLIVTVGPAAVKSFSGPVSRTLHCGAWVTVELHYQISWCCSKMFWIQPGEPRIWAEHLNCRGEVSLWLLHLKRVLLPFAQRQEVDLGPGEVASVVR